MAPSKFLRNRVSGMGLLPNSGPVSRCITTLGPTSLVGVVLMVAGLAVAAQNVQADEPDGEPKSPVVKTDTELLRERGQAIYRSTCADCHGDDGQGEESEYAKPLVGDDSVGQLAKLISDTMPEGNPEECQAEDAVAVAEYVHYSFYSESAQVRNRPPSIAMAHLTGSQLRQSIADLYARFEGLPRYNPARGVRAIYFDGARFKNENKKIERIDPQIDFDFGHESPGEGIKADDFYINWQGGILAESTGRYEIVVRSSCSFELDLGRDGRQFIDNHVQSGDKVEFRKTITLTAGRVYPFKIDFTQRKRKTELPPARITLAWIPPGGVEQVIPTRNLVSEGTPPSFSLQTNLPPDDRSYGYERGIAVTREWDESTTLAALEFAQIAYDELLPSYRRQHRKDEDVGRSQLRAFLIEVVEAAHRQPLSEEERNLFVDKQMQQEPDDGEAVKRVLLIALKSPRFLFATADQDMTVSQRAATRISLTMFDSLPVDQRLREGAIQDRFTEEAQVRAYAEQNVDDYRVRAKMRDFLHSWLNLQHFTDISKDAELFPGFDKDLVNELRISLDAFLDDVVWSESSDYRQLFSATTSFTSERIEKYYGQPWKRADVSLGGVSRTAESQELHGLLTHPFLLSGLAYHDSTSPIHRGVFLIRYMLGRTLRPPAEAFTPLSPDLHPDFTTRQRVELQTSPESCQTCHSKINALGFLLENYDAVGKFRVVEREKPIDSTGGYTTREGQEVKFAGASDLAKYLADSDDAVVAFVSRAFQHFVKQPPAAYGATTLDDLVAKFRENGFSVRKLIVDITVIATRPVLATNLEQVVTKKP